ncbi:hypothetical protein [Kitasatospora cheerisanensis]|uniref:Uncharacterized protein n=1 Tax=Kitasatospora cheerisanensis KCTC 2395 TaxID=1348663 RepID=A0A066YWX9_9ACTN|nr:hypothetical protein [Kitasatospora cheerisanensis]KDN85702.1 hypothetical protein KCH_25300 [Kitasatospora cheerisanensis KCTC 2395]
MIIRIDLRVSLDAERWGEEAGTDPADAARDACWYLSDARDCIPHIGEDGCPADLKLMPGWEEDQDLFGAVKIRSLWQVHCSAADWIAWQENPGPTSDSFTVPAGRAREDLARTVVEGLVGMSLFMDAQAVMTLVHRWRQSYDHARKTRPNRRPSTLR